MADSNTTDDEPEDCKTVYHPHLEYLELVEFSGRPTHRPRRVSSTVQCKNCGSENLWSDVTAYGCSDCGWARYHG